MSERFNSVYQFVDYLQTKGIHVQPDGKDRWKFLCPSHVEKEPSTKVRVKNGWIQVTCFGGCQRDDVLRALGVERKDLCLDRGKLTPTKGIDYDNPDAIYTYTDAEGNLAYQILRFQQGGKRKTFRQRRPDGKGGWIKNIQGIQKYLYHLPEISSAIKEGKHIYFPEGERDVNNLRKLGAVASTNPEGSGKWQDSFTECLRGADLILCPDKDEAGIQHMEKIAKAVRGAVKRLRVLLMPGDAKDATDWINEGHDHTDLENLTLETQDYTPELAKELILKYTSTLPKVIVTNRHMRDITAEALDAVHKQNNPARIFRRSDTLIRISVDEQGRPYTETLGESHFRGELARCCNFMRLTGQGDSEVPISPPIDIVRDGLTRPSEWQFPPLLGITEVPVLRPDGTILTKPGYDEATKLYYYPSPDLEIPQIPENPTLAQLKEAAMLAIEPVLDFPFDTEASWANAIGTMFAPILRPMINSPVPLALFDKPQQGTGASLLAEIVSTVATGRPAAMMTAPEDDAAWKKAITSLLLKGQLVATVDNVEGDLYAPSFAALLTLVIWQDRILGQSKLIDFPHRTVWIATGNNIHLKGDLPRRCIWSRMDAHVARPWLRNLKQFTHPELREWVTNNRGSILAAILTIARAWTLAGKPVPEGIPILGGYEAYCRIIGGVLGFMGVQGFMGNLDDMYNLTDTESPQWASFFEAWYETLGGEAITAAQLVSYINDYQDLKDSLPDALAYIMEGRKDGRDSKNYGVRLGQRLAKKLGVQYPNGYTLKRAGTKKRAVTWQIVRLEAATTSPKFSLQGEVGEVVSTLACRQGNKINNKLLNKIEAQPTSPTSLINTKEGEVAPTGKPLAKNDISFVCSNCGGRQYWIWQGKVKKCAECWTPPEGTQIFEDD